MAKSSALMLMIFGLVLTTAASAAQRFPWTFGMTPEQVKAQTAYGPYRAFSNGDLETYNGPLDGHKYNFQFFFKDGKLVRIMADLYEGRELSAATSTWLDLYRWLHKQFGAIETPGAQAPDADGQAFQATTQLSVQSGAKMQMAPVRQPADAFVFASLRGAEVEGRVYYYLSLYFDPPHT